MPYIKQIDRDTIGIDAFGVDSEGELNYAITSLVHEWIEKRGLRYSTLNSAIGVLECAKAELLRQVVAPYEDQKKQENGPVSELDK